MSDEVINIVLTCDDRYVQHAAVTIVSIVRNSKRKIHFYVFDCGILPENLERLKRLDVGSNILEVVQVPKIDAFENYKYADYYSPAIMYRLAIAEILPNLDKALYLDSDIIALRDIGILYDIDLGDKMMAGMYYEYISEALSDSFNLEVGSLYEVSYFLTGFLLMNLRKMREWHFLEKCIEKAKTFPSLTWPDQDVLSLVLGIEHVKLLNRHFVLFLSSVPSWGFSPKQHVIIAHFSDKPWKIFRWVLNCCPFEYCVYMRRYYALAECTPFKSVSSSGSLWYSFFILSSFVCIRIGALLGGLAGIKSFWKIVGKKLGKVLKFHKSS